MRLLHDLAQALLRRSCGDPGGTVSIFFVISRRHLCEHLVRILLKSSTRSLHDFAKVLLIFLAGILIKKTVLLDIVQAPVRSPGDTPSGSSVRSIL